MHPHHPLAPYPVPESQACYAREGRVVGQSGMILPCLCVQCGASAPEGARRSRTFHHFPAEYWLLGLLLGAWVFLIYLAKRKPVDVNYALCHRCAAAQRRKKTAALGFAAMTWLSMWMVLAVPGALFAGTFVIGALGMVSMAPFMRKPLRVRRKDDSQRFYLEGAHPRVLARLSLTEGRARHRLE